MPTTLQRIADDQRKLAEQSDEAAAEAFRALGYRIAEGEEPGAEEIRKTLADAKKTVDDLTKLVQAVQRRLVYRDQVDVGERADARRAEVEAELAELHVPYQAAVDAYNEQSEPLREERAQLQDAKARAITAKKDLIDSDLSTTVKAERESHSARRLAIRTRKSQIREGKTSAEHSGAMRVRLQEAIREENKLDSGKRRSKEKIEAALKQEAAKRAKELEADDRRLDEELEAIDQRRQELVELALIP